MSNFMRLFVMFDLPVRTGEERKEAARFRKFLLNDGYYMLQYSIYVRICSGMEAVDKHEQRLKNNLPQHGSVRLLRITERQYTAMRILCGNPSPDLDIDHEKTTILTL